MSRADILFHAVCPSCRPSGSSPSAAQYRAACSFVWSGDTWCSVLPSNCGLPPVKARRPSHAPSQADAGCCTRFSLCLTPWPHRQSSLHGKGGQLLTVPPDRTDPDIGRRGCGLLSLYECFRHQGPAFSGVARYRCGGYMKSLKVASVLIAGTCPNTLRKAWPHCLSSFPMSSPAFSRCWAIEVPRAHG